MRFSVPLMVVAAAVLAGCGGGNGGGGSGGSPSAPTATINASAATVNSGESSTLTWSSTNATACTASGGWTARLAASGTQSTGPLTASATLHLGLHRRRRCERAHLDVGDGGRAASHGDLDDE